MGIMTNDLHAVQIKRGTIVAQDILRMEFHSMRATRNFRGAEV